MGRARRWAVSRWARRDTRARALWCVMAVWAAQPTVTCSAPEATRRRRDRSPWVGPSRRGGHGGRGARAAAGGEEGGGPGPVGWTIQPAPPSVPKKADLSEVAVYAAVGDSAFDDDE